MSVKYPKKVIIVMGVVGALLGATVLLCGYANSVPAGNEAPAKTCQASGKMGCCPMMAQTATASCPKMMAAQAESTDGSGTPCMTGCPKPCCAEEGCCEGPCLIPCPKPCCEEGGCCGSTGCPMTAQQTAVQ